MLVVQLWVVLLCGGCVDNFIELNEKEMILIGGGYQPLNQTRVVQYVYPCSEAPENDGHGACYSIYLPACGNDPLIEAKTILTVIGGVVTGAVLYCAVYFVHTQMNKRRSKQPTTSGEASAKNV